MSESENANDRTLIIDATCASSNIRVPQDFPLLNEARKNYLALAKCRRRTASRMRKTIWKQLGYIRRDLGYIDGYLRRGFEFQPNETTFLDTIRKATINRMTIKSIQ